MPATCSLLLQSFLTESTWVPVGMAAAVVLAAWRVASTVTSIRGDLTRVVDEAGRANSAIDRMAVEQGQMRREVERLTASVGALVNDHVTKNRLRLWILQFKVANPGLNVPEFPED